jgi:ribosomal 50S subunit-associated protein YjgA (DUF615 family)
MRQSDLVRHKMKAKAPRTSQIVFGERQHLLRVLESTETTAMSHGRMMQESRLLEELIHTRTQELNRINSAWDEKISVVLNAEVEPETLEKLSHHAPREDYYLLRLISEHPKATSRTLRRLARHPYAAIRENIARHPNADAETLTRLSRDKAQPLWYLVAFNPSAPAALRRELKTRREKLAAAATP